MVVKDKKVTVKDPSIFRCLKKLNSFKKILLGGHGGIHILILYIPVEFAKLNK